MLETSIFSFSHKCFLIHQKQDLFEFFIVIFFVVCKFFQFGPFPNKPWFLCLQLKSFENTVGKGEIARNEQFLLVPQWYLLVWRPFCSFHQIWNCHLQTLWVWKSPKFVVWKRVKFCPLGKELKQMGFLIRHKFHFLSPIWFVVCKCFEFW